MLNDPTKRLIKSPPGGKKLIEVDKKLITKLRAVLKNGKGRVTSGDYQATPIQCIQAAVQENTLEKIETGLWFCCFRSPDNLIPRRYTLVLLFDYERTDEGARRVWNSLKYIELNVPQAYNWVYETSFTMQNTQEILDVLPENISRTIPIGEAPETERGPAILQVIVKEQIRL